MAKLSLRKKYKNHSWFLTDYLVIINVLLFFLTAILIATTGQDIRNQFGFSLEKFISGDIWTPVTSMFLHGNLSHLILNMISLFFFGRAVELEITRGKFLGVYFIGGVVGSLFATLFHGSADIFIGASGAIFAIIAAAMIVKPFEFVAFPYVVPIPIMFVAIVMVISNLALLFVPPEGNTISFASHIGGFIVGMIFGFREKGMKRSLTILIAGIVIFLLLSSYLNYLNLLDYTGLIQKAVS